MQSCFPVGSIAWTNMLGMHYVNENLQDREMGSKRGISRFSPSLLVLFFLDVAIELIHWIDVSAKQQNTLTLQNGQKNTIDRCFWRIQAAPLWRQKMPCKNMIANWRVLHGPWVNWRDPSVRMAVIACCGDFCGWSGCWNEILGWGAHEKSCLSRGRENRKSWVSWWAALSFYKKPTFVLSLTCKAWQLLLYFGGWSQIQVEKLPNPISGATQSPFLFNKTFIECWAISETIQKDGWPFVAKSFGKKKKRKNVFSSMKSKSQDLES